MKFLHKFANQCFTLKLIVRIGTDDVSKYLQTWFCNVFMQSNSNISAKLKEFLWIWSHQTNINFLASFLLFYFTLLFEHKPGTNRGLNNCLVAVLILAQLLFSSGSGSAFSDFSSWLWSEQDWKYFQSCSLHNYEEKSQF